MSLRSFAEIADVHEVAGAAAVGESVDLLIEVPHGATTTGDYRRVEAQLKSSLPADLIDFFYVNTDTGAFELAMAAAAHVVAARPAWRVVVVRCRIPRTFIDCNRRIDASPADFKAGGVTPGIPTWITVPDDRKALVARYQSYMDVVRDVVAALASDGRTLLLHTYAPRTVDVEVDDNIVANMRHAYSADIEPTWPLRPELDVIARDSDGNDHAPRAVVSQLRGAVASFGWQLADSATYPMHPSTMGWEHTMARPGRVLCLEVRRDLLADPFDPFVEMKIGANKVQRLAHPLAAALADWS